MNFSNQEIAGRILQRRMLFLGLLDLKISCMSLCEVGQGVKE